MIRLLNIASLLMLIWAGVLFVFCGTQWVHGMPGRESNPDLSIIDRYKTLEKPGETSTRNVVSPLVKQATAYALYLTPPKPAAPKVTPRTTAQGQPAVSPAPVTAKFRLLATTYYRASPDRSLALVSEPGKGDHWIRKGERVGRFVLEKIEKEGIVYRDGNQSYPMKVAPSQTAQSAPVKSEIAVSVRTAKPDLRLPHPSPSIAVE